ncbi:MAG: complex I subunit 1 family protein [Bacteroidales bacterium]|nr:NADH-quinone oxidoreductase subunit H [Bacteroidales bacterium]MBS3775341.1 NADH-quinone oxidoreductase subunit H [Bacteroidales bacterium]
MGEQIFYFFIYPGLLFAGVVGGLLTWFDRKMTAKVQFRKGPPLLQPFYDFLKLLLVKETILPARGSKITFLLAPLFSLIGGTLAAVFILLPLMNINIGFQGDLLVIFYLLTIPSLFYVIGALASGNPLAFVGASREIKLIISYELTFLLIFAAIILKSGMTINLQEIIAIQAGGNAFIGSLSGVLLFIAALFCVQAKLGLVPFDIAEAETELSEGSFIEYSGTAYALIKFTKYIMLFILPALLVGFFLAGFNWVGLGILWSILKLLLVVLLITLIRNTNPRLKIKQAMRFFLVGMNLLVIIAIILAYFGL